DQYIANMQDGTTAGYKYFAINSISHIEVCVSGTANGIIEVRNELEKAPFAWIIINVEKETKRFGVECEVNFDVEQVALYFTYKGQGYVNFYGFEVD
ncbi:MAG: beta-xylosidase, partial [Lachnospiraceae bacterium]|nr:beta-xylosidase [Lachnospiraceae bacterium]